MKTKSKIFVTAICLASSLFIVSGCSEIEPIFMDSVNGSEELLVTRVDTSSYTITGPDNPTVNTYVTYGAYPLTRIPPADWTVTPDTATVEVRDYDLNIKFNTPGSYTLTATFQFGGTVLTKTVTVLPPTTASPTIMASSTFIRPGESITISVKNPQSGVVYEWESGGYIVSGETGPYYVISIPGIDDQILLSTRSAAFQTMTIRCRSRNGASISGWSNEIIVTIGPPIIHK